MSVRELMTPMPSGMDDESWLKDALTKHPAASDTTVVLLPPILDLYRHKHDNVSQHSATFKTNTGCLHQFVENTKAL